MGKRSDILFFQRSHAGGNSYMKRCSMLLIIREMEIKTMMWNHLTPVIMIIIKMTANKSVGEDVEKRGPL